VMTNPNNNAQSEDERWRAWVQKNKARDEARLAKRKKTAAFILIVGIVIVLFWLAPMSRN
jgi:nicotinamide riboside transporter PnuC